VFLQRKYTESVSPLSKLFDWPSLARLPLDELFNLGRSVLGASSTLGVGDASVKPRMKIFSQIAIFVC
jgi:hypothetical protein